MKRRPSTLGSVRLRDLPKYLPWWPMKAGRHLAGAAQLVKDGQPMSEQARLFASNVLAVLALVFLHNPDPRSRIEIVAARARRNREEGLGQSEAILRAQLWADELGIPRGKRRKPMSGRKRNFTKHALTPASAERVAARRRLIQRR